MNKDSKALNKIPANQFIKNRKSLFQKYNGAFYKRKLYERSHYIKLKEKNHMIVLITAEKII